MYIIMALFTNYNNTQFLLPYININSFRVYNFDKISPGDKNIGENTWTVSMLSIFFLENLFETILNIKIAWYVILILQVCTSYHSHYHTIFKKIKCILYLGRNIILLLPSHGLKIIKFPSWFTY